MLLYRVTSQLHNNQRLLSSQILSNCEYRQRSIRLCLLCVFTLSAASNFSFLWIELLLNSIFLMKSVDIIGSSTLISYIVTFPTWYLLHIFDLPYLVWTATGRLRQRFSLNILSAYLLFILPRFSPEGGWCYTSRYIIRTPVRIIYYRTYQFPLTCTSRSRFISNHWSESLCLKTDMLAV